MKDKRISGKQRAAEWLQPFSTPCMGSLKHLIRIRCTAQLVYVVDFPVGSCDRDGDTGVDTC